MVGRLRICVVHPFLFLYYKATENMPVIQNQHFCVTLLPQISLTSSLEQNKVNKLLPSLSEEAHLLDLVTLNLW